MGEAEFLRAQRPHDPAYLLGRWRALAPRAGMAMESFATTPGGDLFALRSAAPPPGAKRVYLSAGVHGDEPGAALGLLLWAERSTELLRGLDVRLFPLLNPWGLANNARTDARGRDLNRLFHSRANPFPAWRRALGRRPFELAICLHEDYDAGGCYIYELGRAAFAEPLLRAAAAHIPADPRRHIDDSEAEGGVVRMEEIDRESFPLPGLPEAVWLFFERCPHSLTLETPSECALSQRAAAHGAMLDAALARI